MLYKLRECSAVLLPSSHFILNSHINKQTIGAKKEAIGHILLNRMRKFKHNGKNNGQKCLNRFNYKIKYVEIDFGTCRMKEAWCKIKYKNFKYINIC